MSNVFRLAEARSQGQLVQLPPLLQGYGLSLSWIADGQPIPGSFWGDEEAGLQGSCLLVRGDTPVHSALYEAGHFLCMNNARRCGLDTDAGSDDLEEVAVCYLQVLLGEQIGFSREQMFLDMDTWGYSFRLGSAALWVEQDATDAFDLLLARGVIDAAGALTGASNQS